MDIESYIQNDLKINEFYEDNEYFEERTQEHLKDEGLNLSNLLYQDLYFENPFYLNDKLYYMPSLRRVFFRFFSVHHH